MIQISHVQARRLIQAAADEQARTSEQTLSAEQWAQMQAHLEGCADCRAYAQQLAVLENDLRRELSARWANPPAARPGMGRAVAARLGGNALPRRVWSALGAAAMLLLLAALIFGAGRLIPQPARSIEMTATPGPSPTPSPTPLDFSHSFHGVVLYESRQDGNEEIYLLNPGAEPINLTSDPAEDSDPVWSPDGEWIAFLSDRGGKTEVYAMHVSGSRLRQITDSPEIAWTGPLDWSPDGQYLALHGTRRQASYASETSRQETNVYLLPLAVDGAVADHPRTPLLLYPSKPHSPIRFAPNQPLLAFTWGDESSNEVRLYNLRSAESYNFMPARGTQPNWVGNFQETSFDWAPDSSRLVIVDEGPFSRLPHELADNAVSEIAVTTDFSTGIYPGIQGVSLLQKTQAQPGAYHAVGWTPDLNRLTYLIQEGEGPYCLALRLLTSSPKDKVTVDQAVHGLCVESGIERTNWTGPGGWLVVLAHRPGESGSALWAIKPNGWQPSEDAAQPARQLAGDQSPMQVPAKTAQALAEQIPTQTWEPELVQLTRVGDGTQISTPHLRPTAATALDLDPQPLGSFSASSGSATVPPSDAARGTDWLLINRRSGADRYALLEWTPSTGQERELFYDSQLLSCATYSPDRRRIAFVHYQSPNSPDSADWRNEIWLMDVDGGNARQLTQERPEEKDTASPIDRGMAMDQRFYPCPLYWSPDGRTLAAMYANWPNNYVAILPLDGSPAKYVRTTGQLLGWTPDGARLLLGNSNIGGSGLSKLLTIDPATVGEQDINIGIASILRSNGWSTINGLSFSPDGRQMALLVQYTRGMPTRVTKTELRLLPYDPANPDANLDKIEPAQGQTLLTLEDALSTSETRDLHWLPDGTLAFLRSHSVVLEQPSRGEMLRYEPATNTLRTLVTFYDYPLEVIWSPDGLWALYRTESSAGLIDITRAWESQSGPHPIEMPATDSVDWK